MKKLLLLLLFVATPAIADISSKLNIRSVDGTVNTYPYQAKFTNGTVTDNNDGTVSISITGGSGLGSGIVSPGTFTWTNSFGISASTISVSTITAPSSLTAVVIDTSVTLGHTAMTSPPFLKIWGQDPSNTAFGLGSWATIDKSVTTGLMSPLTFTAFNPADAAGEKSFVFNSSYTALGGFTLADFQQGGVSKFAISSDGSITLAVGATFTADTVKSSFNQPLTLAGGFGGTGNEQQPVYVFKDWATVGTHGDLVEFWDGTGIQDFIHGADNSFNRANNWCINCLTPDAQLKIRTYEDSRIGIIIQSSNTTQTANLFEARNASSGTIVSISPAGVITASSTVLTYGLSASTIAVVSSTSAVYETTFSTASSNFHVAISTSGHIVTNGGTPTLTFCGTSPSVVGDDNQGTITIGGGISTVACTVTFNKPWGTSPTCTASDDSVTISPDISSTNATTVVFAFSASLSGGHLYYRCGCSGPTCI